MSSSALSTLKLLVFQLLLRGHSSRSIYVGLRHVLSKIYRVGQKNGPFWKLMMTWTYRVVWSHTRWLERHFTICIPYLVEFDRISQCQSLAATLIKVMLWDFHSFCRQCWSTNRISSRNNTDFELSRQKQKTNFWTNCTITSTERALLVY